MRMNESIMTALRTQWGLSLRRFGNNFGHTQMTTLLAAAASHMQSGKILLNQNFMYIAPSHWFMADGIIADLFFTENEA